MTQILETPRMILRTFANTDAEALYQLNGDAEVMRYLNGGIAMALEEVRDEILPRFIAYGRKHPGLGLFAAISKETSSFVGWFQLRIYEDDPHVLELGYRILRRHWGEGLATEGSQSVIEMAFRDCGAQTIVAGTMKANTGSVRVMEKIGLHFDKEFIADDFPGEDKAAVLYSLTRTEYEQGLD